MVIECIKEGIKLTNRNLQLILVRIAVTIINIAALLIFIGIPIVVAITYLGFDLANAGDLLPEFIGDPFEIASKYIGLTILFVVSLIVYIMFSSILFLYALGGTLGTLKNSAVNSRYRFSLSVFFQEANRNFSRLLWLLSLVSFVIIAALVLLTIMGGIVVAVNHSVSGAESMLETFLNSFMIIFVTIIAAIIVMVAIVFAIYSIVISIIEGKGAVDTVKKTFEFLGQKPHAILFYLVLLSVMITVSFIFYGFQIPVRLVPLMLPFFDVFFYIINAFFHSYLVLIMWSSLTVYYVKKTDYPVNDTGYEI
jgi:hypothetical protein